jgi:hypothetical protein
LTRKWDRRLAWWLSLANLYGGATSGRSANRFEGEGFIPSVADPDKRSHIPAGFESTSPHPLVAGVGFYSPCEYPVPDGIAAKALRLRPLEDRPPAVDAILAMRSDDVAWKLARVARSVFVFLAERPAARPLLDWGISGSSLLAITFARDGAWQIERIDPIESLIGLLRGRNKSSIGKCPVCGRVFERLRKDQKCDLTRCRDVWRKRNWRTNGKTYKENWQINQLVRERGMSVKEATAKIQNRGRNRGSK